MSKPIPVSVLPDEVVYRLYVCRRRVEGIFGLRVCPGERVSIRRSPHATAARSYWVEDEDGTLLAMVGEDSLRKDFVEVNRCAV